MFVNRFIYVSVLPGAVLLRKQEMFLTLFFGACLLALINADAKRALLASIIGLLLPIAEYICIKFNMWKYNEDYKQYTVPLWLWFGWAIVALFVIDVNKYVRTL